MVSCFLAIRGNVDTPENTEKSLVHTTHELLSEWHSIQSDLSPLGLFLSSFLPNIWGIEHLNRITACHHERHLTHKKGIDSTDKLDQTLVWYSFWGSVGVVDMG
jgi:hypothetical protein